MVTIRAAPACQAKVPSTNTNAPDPKSQIWQALSSVRREIRLFVVEPDEDESAPVRGRLITRSLEQHLSYDAISHAWGGPSYPHVVHIDNVEWLVTQSIYEVLLCLRDRKVEKCFWIDALCINQHDSNERAQQVKLMEYIFHRATVVQAWLGRGSEAVGRLVSDMSAPGGLRSHYFARQKPKSQGVLGSRIFALPKTFNEVQDVNTTLVDFARLEYWTRTWVVPELFLARNVRFLHGWQTFTTENLLALWKQYQTAGLYDFEKVERQCIENRLTPVLQTLRTDGMALATSGSPEEKAFELTRILAQTRLSQCGDKRDRIYGIMGIITAMCGPEFMTVNYEQSIADVYTDFTRNLISKTGCLAILNQSEYMCNSLSGLPTWVPDWSSCFNGDDAAYRMEWQRERFKAAGGRPFHVVEPMRTTDQPSRRLMSKGFVFGTVTKIGPCSGSVWQGGPLRYSGLPPMIRSWEEFYPGSSEAFCSMFTSAIGTKPIAWEDCYKTLQLPAQNLTDDETKLMITFRVMASNRRFLITNSGAPGLGPRDTRAGDVLAIMAGGQVPYVLRRSAKPVQDYPNHFSFVGECHVHGVMYGELFEASNPPELEDIWLE